MWEYQVVRVNYEAYGDNQRVMAVNGQDVAPVRGSGLFASYDTDKAQPISEYLTVAGKAGWELVSALRFDSASGGIVYFYFKRPAQ